MRPWRGGTATARFEDEGGLFARQLRLRLHQPDKVDGRREGLVQELELDEEWIHTCAGAVGQGSWYPTNWLRRGACHNVHFFRVPMQAHGSTRSTHARGGSEACSALAAPLTLLAQNPGIESSSRASCFEHVAHAGVVGCHRVELAETAAARLARPAVVEGAGWGRLVLSRVHSLLLSNAALKSWSCVASAAVSPCHD